MTAIAAQPADVLGNAQTASLKRQALGRAGNLFLASAGAGAGIRGLLGLYNMLQRQQRESEDDEGPGPAMIDIPYAVPKTAGFWLDGQNPQTVEGLPLLGRPLQAAAATAGGVAGWKLLDHILDQQRRKELDEEVDRARQEFSGAVMNQFAPAGQKIASQDIGQALDALYDGFEKLAGIMDKPWGEYGGQAAGLYAGFAGTAALLAGIAQYEKTKRRSNRALLEEAVKRRQRQQYALRPSEIYARPIPVETEEQAAAV